MVEKVNVGVRVWIGVVVVVVGMGQIRNVLMDGRRGRGVGGVKSM
jgi:hypothetical protein